MAEFQRREDLERWLKTRSREEAVALAARAALRVAPLLIRARRVRNFRARILQTSFRALDAAIFSVESRDGRATATAAAYAAYAAADAAYAAATAAADAATAAAAAADAAAAAAAAYAAYAADAAYAAEDAYAADLWRGVSRDATALEEGASTSSFLQTPLWRHNPPDWASETWWRLQGYLADFPNEHWDVWTDWYDDRIAGRPIDWDLQRKRVMIPYEENLWNQGPAVVNARIKAIIAEHGGAKPPPPQEEEPQPDPQDRLGAQFRKASHQVDADHAADAAGILQSATTEELHAQAREAGEALENRCDPLGPEANRLGDLKARVGKLTAAMGESVGSVNPVRLMGALTQLESARTADDLRRAAQDPEDEALTPTTRQHLEDVVALTGFYARFDPRLKELDQARREPSTSSASAAASPDPTLALAQKAAVMKGVSAEAVESLQAAQEAEGGFWRRSKTNFWWMAAQIGAGIKTAYEAGKVAGELTVVSGVVGLFLVKYEVWILKECMALSPKLATYMQWVIDGLKTLPFFAP